VTPSLLGFARIQGFELEDLPADTLLARRSIGNGYATTMHQCAMRHYVAYLRLALSKGAPLQIPASTWVPWPEVLSVSGRKHPPLSRHYKL
jgi:hypothetical protein